MPQATRERQGDRSLLDICLEVHAATTGAGDLDPASYISDIHLLRDALLQWEGAPPQTKEFDAAVKQLIEVTIKEAEKNHPIFIKPGDPITVIDIANRSLGTIIEEMHSFYFMPHTMPLSFTALRKVADLLERMNKTGVTTLCV